MPLRSKLFVLAFFVALTNNSHTIALPRPDVKHLKNLKIQENREYLPPLEESPSNTIESTGYSYPKPSVPFPLPNEIETIYPDKKPNQKIQQQPPKLTGSSSNIKPVQVQTIKTTQKPQPLKTPTTPKRPLASPINDYLPPAVTITQRPFVARTGDETRIVSTTVKPFDKDYLPPVNDGSETRINVNIIPSPESKFPTNEYLPPDTTRRPTPTTTTRRPTPTTTRRPTPTTTRKPPTTTTTTPAPDPFSSYAPAANTPIPSIVRPQGPYFTKFDEENGYDYSKPAIGFDLPNNRVPVLNSADDEDDDENTYASASAPTNNVPVYTPATSTTTEDTPPAPDVIYTPSHTLDEDGYRYKVPNKPFNY